MTAEKDALEVLAPAFVEVPLTGRPSITVRPITVGQLPRFVRALKPIVGAVTASAGNLLPPPDGSGSVDAAGLAAEVNLLELYVEHGEALNQAIAIACGQPLEQIEALSLDDALKLALVVWEVNRDFFGQKVMPLLAPTLKQALATSGAGPTR